MRDMLLLMMHVLLLLMMHVLLSLVEYTRLKEIHFLLVSWHGWRGTKVGEMELECELVAAALDWLDLSLSLNLARTWVVV